MMGKILTAQFQEKISYSLERQERCRKATRGTHGLLYIHQHIFKKAKTWRENVAMSWTDDKKGQSHR